MFHYMLYKIYNLTILKVQHVINKVYSLIDKPFSLKEQLFLQSLSTFFILHFLSHNKYFKRIDWLQDRKFLENFVYSTANLYA